MGSKIIFSCCDSTRGQQLCLMHLGGLGAGSVSSKACMVTDRWELLFLKVLIYSVVSLQMDSLPLLCVYIFFPQTC